ncbi:hypothetical protein [Methylobacter marinus]|uniref:hypothetical protein n=1 Tax=Methylobacter marinus TaxID=34058 RepID=UPI000364E9F2|nr:hypothetical protein [Methylobacter marinus]
MFKNFIISLIIFITSLSAWAAPQTYKVTARVSSVSEYLSDGLPAPLQIGDEINMTYVLDDAKSPDYQDDWYIAYSFNENEGSVQISWSNVTLKTSLSQSMIHHFVGFDPNNGNGVQTYHVGGLGPFENNGNPAPDVRFIGLDLQHHNDGSPYQTYTPWLTPDLSKFAMRRLFIDANGYWIDADVTSIVNIQELNGPFAVWPGHGNLHINQRFDVFVSAPEGYDFIEFLTDSMPMSEPEFLPIFCEIQPNYSGMTEIEFLCRDLDAGRLHLFHENHSGVTIRLKNLSTGQSLERVMYWRVYQ